MAITRASQLLPTFYLLKISQKFQDNSTMKTVQIKSFQSGEEQAAHQLVKSVYDEYVAPENTPEGNQHFYDWIAPDQIAKRQEKQNNLWLAWDNVQLAGLIEIRDGNNITLLFVDKAWQKRGIATLLFQTALKECLKRNPDLDKFLVHASLCSVPVYKSFGFKVTEKARKENGIYFVPMELQIARDGQ